jgi:Tol biopolymer transport system component
VVGPGIAPSWSPDGNSIAYRGLEGIYITRADATENHLVVEHAILREPWDFEDWPPFPSWSPDGEWLVYHKCLSITGARDDCTRKEDFAIFKLNVESGEETKIIDGGLNPYWRQR